MIGYEGKDEKPDTDFQLVFGSENKRKDRPQPGQDRPDSDDGYFLLLAAPTVTSDSKPAPKDVVFVVDTSGSMAGQSFNRRKRH